MNNTWLALAAVAGLGSLFPVLLRMRQGFRGTALESAWFWAALVWIVWLSVTFLTIEPAGPHGSGDILWYLAAVLALTPPIAVLGARRPTSRVWTAFVLVPLVLVFSWPLVPLLRTVLLQHEGSLAFSLEEPLALGYVVVLVMGAGNYVGLRFSFPALLWMAGIMLVVLPLCPTTATWAFAADTGRSVGTLCLVAAAWIADRQVARRASAPSGSNLSVDRLWQDFRDLFGIVWSRRVQERFNDEARRKGLGVQLGMNGLEDAAGKPLPTGFDPQALSAAETSLCWFLQKFVDREWIEQRLREIEPRSGGIV